MAHAADPGKLLAISRDVYGHCPRAWWLTIPIETLEFGDRLSPVAQQGFEIALEKIRSLALSEIAGA
jgi:Ni,Fe-hydrogenase maturation factor